MNPLDILQRTPKTNCGECGHPTCLAFSAAVSRAGTEITLCPYIDLQGFNSKISGDKKNMNSLASEVAEEHDLALVRHLQEKVRALDFGSIAKSLGAGWHSDDQDTLYLRYLGQDVVLGKTKILVGNTDVPDPRDQILLYNYVHSRGGRKPDNTWIGMESLPNSISKVKTLATYCEKRIAEHLSGKPADTLREIGRQLDGYEGPEVPAPLQHLLFRYCPWCPNSSYFGKRRLTMVLRQKPRCYSTIMCLIFLTLNHSFFLPNAWQKG